MAERPTAPPPRPFAVTPEDEAYKPGPEPETRPVSPVAAATAAEAVAALTPPQLDASSARSNSFTSSVQMQNRRSAPTSTSSDLNSILHSEGFAFIQQRIRDLVRAFAERAQRFRRRLELPPTPSPEASEHGNDADGQQPPPTPAPAQLSTDTARAASVVGVLPPGRSAHPTAEKQLSCSAALDPQGSVYVSWLFIVTLCYTYNCWVIPLRCSFPYQTKRNTPYWLVLDYIADLVYILDVLFFKPRLVYLSDGFWVHDLTLTRKRYLDKWQFKMDVLSLLPLDILYLKYGTGKVLLRLPRMLKVQTFWEFYEQLDSILSSPYVVRISRTLTYMLYLIHLNACAYYAVSEWEKNVMDVSNDWVFNGEGIAYIRCFYFATKTATSIGKNPKPTNDVEFLFMTWSWLMGVFVFALLIGQVRDIIVTATRPQSEYRRLLDATLKYMRRFNLPQKLQERVKMWFVFTWEQQHTLDESRILNSLPPKLKTDVAINVHIQTLSKVQLFHDCDEALLRDLVLKLRPIIYLPGDVICHKGEVGKEMYIVKVGQVQVMGGKDDTEVLATLTEGSVFGEISLLALSGGNRRTATVRSRGFSNLFVLSKNDLNEAIVHYPEAQEILKKKANAIMRENAAREKLSKEQDKASSIIINNKGLSPETPRLVHTVIQVMGHLDFSTKTLAQSNNKAEVDLARYKKIANTNNEDSEDNKFECRVTVHREMSQ